MGSERINNDNQSVGLDLLSDIDRLTEGLMENVIPSRTLLNKLINDEESDWSHFNYGRPISSKGLAKILRPYGVTPLKQRNHNVYGIEEIKDAIERYIGHTLQ